MVLFANEPPTYRDAMSRAVAERTGLEVAALPLGDSIEDGLRATGAPVLVTSAPAEAAARLSERVAVVDLTYEPDERVAVYRDGERVRDEPLEGLDDLAGLLAEIAPAERR